jgi:hypothetical protein
MVEYWQDKIGVEWEDSFEVWDGYDEDREVLCISELKELVN